LLAIFIPFLPGTIGVEAIQQNAYQLPVIEILANQPLSSFYSSFNYTTAIYGLVAIGLIFTICRKLYFLQQLKSATLLSVYKNVKVFLSEKHDGSFSFFNSIYISENHLEHAEIILLHEYAHCKQKHTIDLIYTSCLKALFWFNPIVYLWDRLVRENHEFLADQAVIDEKVPFKKYAETLVQVSLNCSIPNLTNGFNSHSELLKRIKKMKHKNQINMKHLVLIPLLGGMVVTTTSLTNSPVNTVEKSSILIDKKLDKKSEFKGGMDAMIKYFQNNLKYPESLAKNGTEAKVYIEFMVEKSGAIDHIKVAKGAAQEEFNTAAVEFITNMPKWNPGIKDGKAVSSKMTLPIFYTLN